jgi:hypothetical protein
MVSPIDSTIDKRRQPGRKRTCVRSPDRFQITNIAHHLDAALPGDRPGRGPGKAPARQRQRAAHRFDGSCPLHASASDRSGRRPRRSRCTDRAIRTWRGRGNGFDRCARHRASFLLPCVFTAPCYWCPARAVQGDRSHSRPFAPRLDGSGRCRVPAKQAASRQRFTRRDSIQTSVRAGNVKSFPLSAGLPGTEVTGEVPNRAKSLDFSF